MDFNLTFTTHKSDRLNHYNYADFMVEF